MSEEKNQEQEMIGYGLKPIKVVLDTPTGTKELIFEPTIWTEEEKKKAGGLACHGNCPYGCDLCMKIPCPLNYTEEDDPDIGSRFSVADICGALGDKNSKFLPSKYLKDEYRYYRPAPGTLEDNFPEFQEIYDSIYKDGKTFFSLGEVIDTVCPDTCDLYCKDHSRCTTENGMCFLKDLLEKRNNRFLNKDGFKDRKDRSSEL